METDPVTIFLFLKMRAGEVSCDLSETLRPGYRGLVQVAPGKESKDKSTLGILEFSRETEPIGYIQLTLEQHRSELHTSAYMQIFFNEYRQYYTTSGGWWAGSADVEPWIQRTEYRT